MDRQASSSNTSQIFDDPTSDVILESSDGVLFRLHSKYFSATSAGLSAPDQIVIDGSPVKLQETSDILEILCQFVEPPSDSRNFRHPSVVDLEPTQLFALAEAAEKYVIFSAMSACITVMHFLTEKHPLDILNHSFKHGYKDLIQKSVPPSLNQPNLAHVAQKLTTPGLLAKWLIYYSRWRDIAATGDMWFQLKTKEYKCGRAFALWTAYIRNCLQVPKQPQLFLDALVNTSTKFAEMACPYDDACECKNQKELFDLLSCEIANMPFFDEV